MTHEAEAAALWTPFLLLSPVFILTGQEMTRLYVGDVSIHSYTSLLFQRCSVHKLSTLSFCSQNPDIHSFKLCLEPRAFDKTQKKKELKWGNIQACVSNAFRAFHTLNDWGALSGADSISSERESSSGNSEAVEESGRLKFLVFMLQCFIPLESHHEYKQNRACTPEAP